MRAAADPRLVVYTCITAGYDEVRPVRHAEPGVRYVCFSDRPVDTASRWEGRPLPRTDLDPVSANRYVKMHPHALFPEHERSIYIDGNFELGPGVRAFAEEALREHPLALFSHPERECLFAEAAKCAAIGYGWIWSYARQLRRYRAEGMPARAGLYECGVLPRAHHAPPVQALMAAWWQEFRAGVRRDQISMPYLLWKLRTPCKVVGESRFRNGDPRFILHPGHSPSPLPRLLRGQLNRMTPQFWLLRRGHG